MDLTPPRSPRPRGFLLLLALVVLAGGCGGAQTVTAQHVVDTFREQTGKHLVRESASSGGTWDVLEFDDADPNFEWGAWTLYVGMDDTADDILLADDAGKPLHADENGIYWERADIGDGPYWIVHKRYAANVYLSFIGERTKEQSLDAAFDRVDTALRALDD